MKTWMVLAMLLLTAALPLLRAGQRASAPLGQRLSLPLDGAQIFHNYCAACHGSNGKGHGPATGALRHAPPDLTLSSRRNGGKFLRDRVKAIIAGQEQSIAARGSREMPIWGPALHDVEWDQDLGEVRLDNVTRFVESLQQK